MTLEIQSLTAGYAPKIVLRDISIRAARGELLGIIGANGAGKSTLIRVLSGVLAPKTGSVSLDGALITRLPPRARAQKIAVVPQGVRLPDAFTVSEVVMIGRTCYLPALGRERAEDWRVAREAMAQTDLLALADRFIGELSGGEQQRALVARALAQEPQVLLLDEATAHLDLKHQADILNLVRRLARARGLIVIAAMHDLNLAALYADRLALLRAGELIALDTPARVLTESLLERAYDTPVILARHPLSGLPLVTLRGEEKIK